MCINNNCNLLLPSLSSNWNHKDVYNCMQVSMYIAYSVCSRINDVAWAYLLLVCFSVCPLLCRHPQRWCIHLLGQGRQSPHLNHWCWLCWQCIQLFQLAEKVDMSQSTQEILLPDGGWVGSSWQGQLCCCSFCLPSHCSPGQWALGV